MTDTAERASEIELQPLGTAPACREAEARTDSTDRLAELVSMLERAEKVARTGSWRLELDTQRLTWSAGMYRLFGMEPERDDLDIETVISRAVHPDDRAAVALALASASDADPVRSIEFRVVDLDGSVRWVQAEGAAERDADGTVLALVGFGRDITSVRAAAVDLRASEAAFRATFEQSAVGMAHVGVDGSWVRVNERLCAMLGYTRDELLSLKFSDLTYPEDVDDSVEHLGRMLRGEADVYETEKRYVHKDGSVVWVNLNAATVRDDQSNACYFVTVLEDITSQKRAQAAQALSEMKFATAFHTSPDAVNINRLTDGLFIDANQGFTELTGYTSEDVAGKTSVEICIWADLADRDRLVAGLRGEGSYHNLEAVFRRKDGSLTTGLMSARLIEVDGEQCILSVSRDIAERKAADEELRRSRHFIASILDSTPNLVYIFDLAEHKVVYANREVAEFLGYAPREIREFGSNVLHELLHPDDMNAVAQHHDRCVGAPDGLVLESEYRLRHARGDWRWLRSRDIPFARDEHGRVTQILASADDITESKTVGDALRQSERWLNESQRVAGLGHYIYDIESDHWEGSPSLYEVLGIDPSHERDFNGWLDIVAPEDRERLARYFIDEVIGDSEPFDMEYPIVRPRDGVRRWAHGIGTVDRAEDGHPLAMFGIIQDVTERKIAEQQLGRSLESIIEVVSRVVELRDPYTAGHQRRVAQLAVAIAEEMDTPAAEVEEIRISGLIHDVGKISVPVEILSRPGKLASAEFELIKRHAQSGYEIIESADMRGSIAEMVWQHHERCDGSGYPRGLSADALLGGAKILAVADVVEAMVSHRPYRPGLGIQAALEEIELGAGSLYDPDVCKACGTVFRDGGFAFAED